MCSEITVHFFLHFFLFVHVHPPLYHLLWKLYCEGAFLSPESRYKLASKAQQYRAGARHLCSMGWGHRTLQLVSAHPASLSWQRRWERTGPCPCLTLTPAWNYCVQKFRYSHNNKSNTWSAPLETLSLQPNLAPELLHPKQWTLDERQWNLKKVCK